MGLNSVAEYLKIPLEMAVDLRRRQERSNQAQEKLVQGSRSGGPETFHYYESSTSNNGYNPAITDAFRVYRKTVHPNVVLVSK